MFKHIGKVEWLSDTDLFLVLGEQNFVKSYMQFPIEFKAVRLHPDDDSAEVLMTSKQFTIPYTWQAFSDMKWGRFAYMNTENLQLVIMDFAAGKDEPVDIVLTSAREEGSSNRW